MVSLTNDQLERLVAELLEAGFRFRREGPPIELQHTNIVQLKYEPPDALVKVPAGLLVVKTAYARQALQGSVPVSSKSLGFASFSIFLPTFSRSRPHPSAACLR